MSLITLHQSELKKETTFCTHANLHDCSNSFIQALDVKNEIECPEVFIDDPHSGTTCKHANYVLHVGVAEFV